MIIAISQRRDKNKYGIDIDNLESTYVDYLKGFGIDLISVPNSLENVEKYLSQLPIDGIILSGGNDINPAMWGSTSKISESVSDNRDETEKRMLDFAVKNKLPVLGICRGMQFICVYFGCKLIENLNEEKSENHVVPEHDLIISDEFISKSLGEKSKVNSFHNQGINEKTLPKELNVFCESPLGSIEGVYHNSLPIAGIIWHPERKSPDSDLNNKIISSFVKKEMFWK